MHSRGSRARVRAQGPDPAAVLDLFKLPSISLPPYDMAGQVTWRDDEAKVTGLDGKLGDSDISGDAGIDLRPEPPAVTAKLHSDLLDLDDLAGLVGAPPAAPRARPRVPHRSSGRSKPSRTTGFCQPRRSIPISGGKPI